MRFIKWLHNRVFLILRNCLFRGDLTNRSNSISAQVKTVPLQAYYLRHSNDEKYLVTNWFNIDPKGHKRSTKKIILDHIVVHWTMFFFRFHGNFHYKHILHSWHLSPLLFTTWQTRIYNFHKSLGAPLGRGVRYINERLSNLHFWNYWQLIDTKKLKF